MTTPPVPTGVADLTLDWLNSVLVPSAGATVTDVSMTPVGTGQMADSVRLHLTWDEPDGRPPTLVAKVTPEIATSRDSARATRAYEIEVGFYNDLAPVLGVKTPHCWAAQFDAATDGYVLLLEDAAPASQGDQMAGCSADEAALAIDEMALLHVARRGDDELKQLEWLYRGGSPTGAEKAGFISMMIPMFLERYADRLSAEVVEVTQRLGADGIAYFTRDAGPSVTHTDFRVDNLLFGRERVFVLDWQTAGLGPGEADLSYFLGGSFVPDVRAQVEHDLVARYHGHLEGYGVDVSFDDVWWGYRRYALDGLVMAAAASILVQRTDRGDDMFVTMAERSGRHAIDLDCLGTWA